MNELSPKDINMPLKEWKGLLELKSGEQIQAQIIFDDVDNSFVINELREIFISSKKETVVYREVNPFELSVFSIIRQMMSYIK